MGGTETTGGMIREARVCWVIVVEDHSFGRNMRPLKCGPGKSSSLDEGNVSGPQDVLPLLRVMLCISGQSWEGEELQKLK
jgi:hypothetical protein